ncbi:acyl-CoA synthetase [Natronomonas pharaonis DSM 2160]|uniref:Acyl-CoA synthetase n=1 Tax=Natronomonas pharaonis (strain ATCC 35678 / DSM 2160 / CIP 103997 / JCM 8858 / NBRC 14720 / NCIMB 2260 / Gabara) TaxID=348780 RepID=A0A1U7ETF0_NATPD|nr:AMP-binding protein [Natronomonas pharaonis]CAI48173.1 acyl-CoA synthetase [Natronomonas pharaonis DSM 2160]
MVWHVTVPEESYEQATAEFTWDIPNDYNAAYDLVGKHEHADRPALFQAYPDGRREEYSFGDLDDESDRLANALADLGVGRGDRVGVVLPQVPANPITHLACWKLGAVSMPLSVLFGPDGLQYRLDDSEATVAVVDRDSYETVDGIRERCAGLEHVVEVDWAGAGHHEGSTTFSGLVAAADSSFEPVDTSPETPAIIMYTSGSTGPPKGALHTHSVWVGHCPAFKMYFELDMSEAVFWTPADWAWIGALGDLVFPAWHYGRPVVGYPMGEFDPELAFELSAEFDVTSTFLPPTAIRMLMGIETDSYDLSLEAICSGGEPLTSEILEWAEAELDGVAVNELYGQTEANLLVCNCQSWFPAQAGSMGKPVPGHEVAVVDPDDGTPVATGEVGQIAVKRTDDPVVFEEYWNQPEKTASVTVGGWHLTGDLAERDEDGYIWFKSRDDDIIITSGYRVGPGEVEEAILEHPDIEQAGVVGVPDETRGEIIKAFCQPVEGVAGDDGLRTEVQSLVKENLAKHEYPRELTFVDELPTTTTGKIRRTELRKEP